MFLDRGYKDGNYTYAVITFTKLRHAPDPPDLPDLVSSTATRDPPTTRAVGQDDGHVS